MQVGAKEAFGNSYRVGQPKVDEKQYLITPLLKTVMEFSLTVMTFLSVFLFSSAKNCNRLVLVFLVLLYYIMFFASL